MKSLTGKVYEAIRPKGLLEFYVGGWHKIKLGKKITIGGKYMGYQVAFPNYKGVFEFESESYFGKGLHYIGESELDRYFEEVL